MTEDDTFVLVDDLEEEALSMIDSNTHHTQTNHFINSTANINTTNNHTTVVSPNKHNNKLMDDSSSMGGWSEVSMPSSFSNRPKKVEESNYSGSVTTVREVGDECKNPLPIQNENENNHNKENTAEIAFSWAEITKIQPTFQREEGHLEDAMNEKNNDQHHQSTNSEVMISGECVPLSGSTATKKSTTVGCNGSKNNPVNSNTSDGQSNVPSTLIHSTTGSELSSNKESSEKRPKRAGKKRARFKQARGRRDGNSKKNFGRRG